MKLTKNILKRIIREEIQKLNEGPYDKVIKKGNIMAYKYYDNTRMIPDSDDIVNYIIDFLLDTYSDMTTDGAENAIKKYFKKIG